MTAAIILERHHAFGITDSFSTSSSHVCTVFHRPTILSTKRNGAFCRYASGLSPREIQRIRINPEHFIESAIPFSYFWRTQQPRLFSSSHYTGNIKNFPQKAYAFRYALRLRLAFLGIYIVNSTHKRPLRGHCAPVLAVNPANRAAPAACALGDLHRKKECAATQMQRILSYHPIIGTHPTQ